MSPAAYSLIGDLFSRSRRGLAASIFLAAGSMASFLAYIFGGFAVRLADEPVWGAVPAIADLAAWRRVLLIVGCPPILGALLLWLTMAEPPRTATAHHQHEHDSPASVLTELRRRWRLYLALMVGCTSPSMISQTINAWMPEILRRTLHWPIDRAAIWSGLVGTAAVAIGITGLPMLAEVARRHGPAHAPLLVAGGSALIGFVCAAGSMLLSGGVAILSLMLPALIFMGGCVSIGFNAVLQVAPAHVRATLMSITLISATLMGIGTGPALSAWIAGHVLHDPARLGLAIVVMIASIAPITLLLLIAGIKPLRNAHFPDQSHDEDEP